MISVRSLVCAGAVSLLSIASVVSAAASVPGAPTGDWINPAGTVEVNARPCGNALCGRVVWASPDAISDAREGGTPNLIGTELLHDYHPAGRQTWRGTIFVPDIGKSFSSKMEELDPTRLQVSGCLIAGFICKKQVWHRVNGVRPTR